MPPKQDTGWSRLPQDWQPSAELMEWARGKRTDMTLEEIKDETENFLEFWLNKQGRDAQKKDWNRTYQTWMRRAVTRRRPGYRPPDNGGVVL